MRTTVEESARTRSSLLEAGMHAFAGVGLANATLAAISADAGLTRGAAYHHFQGKADLYLAAVGERWAEVGEVLWEPLTAPGDPVARIRHFLTVLDEPVQADERLRELLVVLGRNESVPLEAAADVEREAFDRLRSTFADVLLVAHAEGTLRPGVEPAAGVCTAADAHHRGRPAAHLRRRPRGRPGDGPGRPRTRGEHPLRPVTNS